MEYIRPRNMKDALQVMKRWNDKAKLIAGGTNVLPDIRAKVLKPQTLIDLSHLRNLSYIKEEKKRIRVGGLTTVSEIASSKTIQRYAAAWVIRRSSMRLKRHLSNWRESNLKMPMLKNKFHEQGL